MKSPVKTHVLQPIPRLAPLIESYVVVVPEEVVTERSTWTIMPDGSPYIILHVFVNGQDTSLKLVGPRSVAKNIDRSNRQLTIAVKFIPGTISPFLPFPLTELRDQAIPLSDVWGELNDNLLTELYRLGRNLDIIGCIVLIEKTLMDKLSPTIAPSDQSVTRATNLIRQSVDLIYQSYGQLRIGRLADHLGVSNRHLRNLFEHHVGLSPKRLCRISRITEAIRYADNHVFESWASLAYKVNYYDQSHLIEDFNALFGESPERLRRRVNREQVV